MEKVQEQMYEQAYADYLGNNNEGVHEAYAEMMRKYPLSKIMPKFMFIDALSYVTQKNYDKFKSTLKEMLERYPETDITPTASGIVKQLNKGRQLNGGSTNARGMLWATRLSNDSTATNAEKKFTPFKEGKDKPQLFIYAFSTDSVSANQLLYEVAKHNFTSFVVKDFELEQMTFGEIGLLVVKGFANYAEVAHYRQVMDADTAKVIPAQAHPIIISKENFDLLVNEGRSFADYFQYLEEQNTAKVEKQIPANATDDATRDNAAKPSKRKSVRQASAQAAKAPAAPVKAATATTAATQPDTAKATATPARPQSVKAAPAAKDTTAAAQPDTVKTNKASTGNATRHPAAADTTVAPMPVQEAKQDSVPAAKPAETAKQQSTTNARTQAQKPADATDSNKSADNVKRLKKQKDEAQLEHEREQKQREKEEKERIKLEKEAEKARIKQQKDAENEAKRQLKLRQKEHDDSVKLAKKQEADALKLAQKQKTDALKQEQRAKQEAQKQQENERKLKQKQLEEDRKQRIEARKQRQKEREQKKKEEQKRKEQEAKERKEAYKQRQKERAEQAKQRAEERKQQKAQKSKGK